MFVGNEMRARMFHRQILLILENHDFKAAGVIAVFAPKKKRKIEIALVSSLVFVMFKSTGHGLKFNVLRQGTGTLQSA